MSENGVKIKEMLISTVKGAVILKQQKPNAPYDPCKNKADQEPFRDFLVQIIRLKLKDYSVRDRTIFELTLNSSISALELVDLNVSDVDFSNRAVIVKRDNETVYIPIIDSCLRLLKVICSTVIQSDYPLFTNNKGERLSLSNLWFITRSFSIEHDESCTFINDIWKKMN